MVFKPKDDDITGVSLDSGWKLPCTTGKGGKQGIQ